VPISSATLATAARQDTGNTSVASIDTKLPSGLTVTANRLQVELPAGGSGLTDTELRATAVPVSGTVTANLSATDNAVLDTIDTSTAAVNTKTPALGQALAAASVPVILPTATITTLTPPAAITGFSTAARQDTIIGHVDDIEGLLTTIDADTGSIDTKTPALGQALAASSVPVVLTAAQVTTLTPPAAITGFATSALQLANNHNVVVTSAPTTAVTGTFFQATQPVSLASVPSHAVTNAGTFPVQVDAALPTGSNAIGKLAANSGIDIGDVTINNTGATPYKLISAASTNATSLKGSAGTIFGIQVYNSNASARFLKIYNKATAPTVGTDVPIKVIPIPGNSTANQWAGTNIPISFQGLAFGTGIAFALTTGVADADTGAVAASEIVVNIDYT